MIINMLVIGGMSKLDLGATGWGTAIPIALVAARFIWIYLDLALEPNR